MNAVKQKFAFYCGHEEASLFTVCVCCACVSTSVCLFFQLKMVLIKCCDISNEVRPTEVAEPWVDCLLEEYFMQVTPTKALMFISKSVI